MAFESGTGLISARPETGELVRRLAQGSDFLTRLNQTAAPFRLMLEGGGGADASLVGDRPAIVVANNFAERIISLQKAQGHLPAGDVLQTCLSEACEDSLRHELTLRLDGIFQPLHPHSMTQLAYAYDLLDRELPLLFALGPTGTGKTYLAIAAALNQLDTDNVKHLVITRSHVRLEGEVMNQSKRAEKDRDEQFDLYIDILNEFLGPVTIQKMLEERKLEIAPLGTLRGRTLTDTILLIDEAQNIDKHWMRLAITRAGQNSRMIVTGDPTHSVLRTGEMNGLTHLLQMIEGRDIGRIHKFLPKDIVRNNTVAQLETLYQQAAQNDVELALHQA
jgi:phosphate starvation-inducible PhoH-like protein